MFGETIKALNVTAAEKDSEERFSAFKKEDAGL